MSKISKIIISFILILSMNLGVVAFADYTSSNYQVSDYFFALLNQGADAMLDTDGTTSTFTGLFLKGAVGAYNGGVCPLSDDGLHHSVNGTHSGFGSDEYGDYTRLLCEYCGESFKCYSDDFSNAYNDHVAEMPGTNYTSAGTLLITAEHDCCYVFNENSRTYYFCTHSDGTGTAWFTGFPGCDGSVSLYPSSGSSSFGYAYIYYSYVVNCSISGTYKCLSSPSVFLTNVGYGSYGDSSVSKSWNSTSGSYYSAGSSFTNGVGASIGSNRASVVGNFYAPTYEVTPAAGTTTTNYYVNASRPTYNITYDLATVNNYGDYTVINNVYENQTIINEGDNIYTDIKTGNEYEIEGWEFDYTTRTYHLTLDNGDLVDVTFGDKYVTVELNGEVEYYYYATEDDSAAGCSHDYDLAESVAATCTEDGYNVYVCTLCNHSYQDQTFAIGHNYQFLWTVLDTYEVDTSTLVCPGCNGTDITCTQVDNTENFTCVCNSADCAQTWTVVGSTIAGYDLYQCINCQEFYNDYTHEGVDRSDAGYWSWLQTWLQNFKTWLGEKLDALINKEVAVGGDTINNEEVNNFYDQSDTTINTDESIDYNITYTDSDGTEQETSLKGIIAKFAFIKDIWKIGQTLISVVSEDAAYAYEFDPTIGNEATTDTGTEVAVASITEEADTLLSSGSGAPSIPLNLGAAQSVYGFNYGGEVEMLDLSWYTPYKETVDKLVGGFLWLFFMWKLFQKAPGIISGASMDSSKVEDVKSGTKGKRR